MTSPELTALIGLLAEFEAMGGRDSDEYVMALELACCDIDVEEDTV